MSKDKKNDKEKIVYIDDGSTISDMSGVDGTRPSAFGSRPESDKRTQIDNGGVSTGNKFVDSWKTYFQAVKLMLVPMLVTVGIISAAFLIMWLLLTVAS